MIPRLHFWFGACDPKWGAWEDVPERVIGWYSRMLPRIRAEETQRQISVAFYTYQRGMADGDRQQFQRDLTDQLGPQRRSERAPRASLGFLRDAGVHIAEGGET